MMASGGAANSSSLPITANTEDTAPQGDERYGKEAGAVGASNVLNQTYIAHQTNVENKFYNGPVFVPCCGHAMEPPPPPRQPPKRYGDYNDPAFFARPKPVDVSIFFSDEELERKVEQPYLVIIAKAVDETRRWRKLARKLKLVSNDFVFVENFKQDGIQEMVYQSMNIWRKRNPEATVKDLVARLVESDFHEAAIELRRSFRSLHCLEWNPDHEAEGKSKKDVEKGEREIRAGEERERECQGVGETEGRERMSGGW